MPIDDPNRLPFLQLVEKRRDIEGRFTNIHRLGATGGEGYFSLLFRATDQKTGDEVAVKVFHPNHRNDPYRWASFQREADVLEKLKGQKGIIGWVAARSEFVETLTAQGISIHLPFAYYALELANDDFGSIIAAGGLAVHQSLLVFHDMCKAVRRLHLLGYAHRDLKPGNFLTLNDLEVRLCDFGTTRNFADGSAALLHNYSFPPGDLRYSAPEMLACLHDEDAAIAVKADVFSLGCILFELLTGTMLGVHIFDQQIKADLTQVMGAVGHQKKHQIFHQFIGSIEDAHPLPDLASFGSIIPRSILKEADELYKSMAALDYRKRLCDFERIYLRIRRCLLILENEEKYRRWRAQREQYRIARLNKLERRNELWKQMKQKVSN